MKKFFKSSEMKAKKPILNQATLNVAVKSMLSLINELDEKRLGLEKTKIELRIFKDDYESTSKKNVEVEEQIQALEMKLGERELQIRQLDQNAKQVVDDYKNSSEELEETRLKVKVLESEVNELREEVEHQEHRGGIERSELMICIQEKNTLDAMCKEMEELIAEKDIKQIELNEFLAEKVNKEGQTEALLSRRDEHCQELQSKSQELQSKINYLNDEILQKDSTIEEMSLQYNQLRNHKLVDASQCQLFLDQENRSLKFKVQEYEECLSEMRVSCEKREEKLCTKIEYLKDELQKMDGAVRHQELPPKSVPTMVEKSVQSEWNVVQHEPIVIDDLDNSRKEFQDNLRALSKQSKQQQQMTNYLKSKDMSRTEQSLQAKYDISESGIKVRKLNKMAIANDNRKSLLTRLEKLQDENKQLLADSRESYEMSICKGENTKLAEKIRIYENEIRYLTKKLSDTSPCREENTKLAERMKGYEEKLKTLNGELKAKEELQVQNKSLQVELRESEFKSKGLEKENESLEKMVAKLSTDVEYFRTNSMKLGGNTSCCMELKVNIAYLEKQVGHLEKTNEHLEEKVKTSIGAEERLKVIEQTLGERERDLKDARRELNQSKERLQKVEAKYLERRGDDEKCRQKVVEQPNVNVHVHLDPQQYLGGIDQSHYNPAPFVVKEQISSGDISSKNESKKSDSEQVIRQLQRQIRTLNQQNKKMKSQLQNVVVATDQKLMHDFDQKQSSIDVKELENLKVRNHDLDKKISELESTKTELESKIKESNKNIAALQESENSMKKKIEYLKCSAKSFEEESKLKDEEHQQVVADFRKRIHEWSENDDMTSLRRRLQDLNSKKEKHEELIDKMKEDKADLKMTIQRLERELEKAKDSLAKSSAKSKQKKVVSAKSRKTVKNESESEEEESEDTEEPPQPKQKVTKTTTTKSKDNGLPWLKNANTNNAKEVETKPVAQATQKTSSKSSKAKPIWLSNSDNNDNAGTPTSKTSKSSKTEPLWLSNSDDNDNAVTTSKTTTQNKKSSGPSWLTSSATSTSAKTANDQADKASDSEDDFLGIKAASKKRNAVDRKTQNKKEEYLFGSLDISNRRGVAKRSNPSEANNTNDKADSASEDDIDAIFGRRGPPILKQQPADKPVKKAKTTPASVVRKTSQEQMLEDFFRKPQKKKEENDEDLSFLTLDDL